jgi:hypothetical protein
MSASAVCLQPPSPSAHFAQDSDDMDIDMDTGVSSDAGAATQQVTAGSVTHPALSAKETSTIIFDWDDTLLPSSWLSVKGLRLDYPAQLPQDVIDELETHQESVCAVLTKAAQCGTVVIITNAETGWVELSAQRFMPRVAPLLAHICVFSARSTYEPMYPDSPLDWKLAAFKKLVDQTRPIGLVDSAAEVPQCSVISFGDSTHERDAVRKVTAHLSNTFTKSVKFVERPNLEQLRREVDLVRNCLDYIVGCKSDLDLMLTIQLLFAGGDNTGSA